ncbi:STAS domain-containing protein, partial [Micromonospora sp. NPDC049799]|uniref:STAS domain-containing protein n=1 Tax=Micromonospora sp. NPDC049799 TaxID=3154741 RepID=UPI0033C30834
MPSRITCEVRDWSPVTVVRLHGGLDLGTMRSVHTVLDRCLSTQPDALVVDLADVTVRDRLALSVFAATARQAADWPGVPVVLCSPPPDAAAWLAEST